MTDTTTTSGGHRLLAAADRKHTEPIPQRALDWLTAFGLDLTDQDDSFQIFRANSASGAPVVGAAWGPAADNADIWFVMDWRSPKEATRVEGARNGALYHLLRGEEIRRAAKHLPVKLTHLLARHEYDEAIFDGFFCSGDCMTPGQRAGDDDLTAWPCQLLREAGLTHDQAEAFIRELRKVYEIGRWPAGRAQ